MSALTLIADMPADMDSVAMGQQATSPRLPWSYQLKEQELHPL